jgi:RNA-binding protein YhbY
MLTTINGRAAPGAACYRWRAPPQRAVPPPPAASRPAAPSFNRARPGMALRLRAAPEGAGEVDRRADGADGAVPGPPPVSPPLACEVGRPERRYQAPLPIKDRKAHKAAAEELAKENRLVKFQLGAQGLSAAFLTGCVDALLKHGVVRVKLGGFSKQELAAATELLEATLDCLVVHQIGHTLTLYRQPGLPRPSNLPPMAGAPPEQFEYEGDAAKRARHAAGAGAAEHAAAAAEAKLQRRRDKAARDSAAARKLPPQFQVL